MMLIIIFIILIAILGAVIGSFLGVVLDRSFRDEQFASGRSYCESCKNKLSQIELIPIFSYIYLGGKCRYCYSKIPPHLFLFELIMLISYSIIGVIFYNFGLFFNLDVLVSFIYSLFLTSLLIFIFISDLRYMAISTFCFIGLFSLYVVGVLINLYLVNMPILNELFFSNYYDHLFGALAMLIFFWPTYYFSKEKLMGEGDVYLGALFGLFLGFKLSLVMWFVSFLIGALVGLGLIISRSKTFKSALPFGPFLIIGFILSIFFGDLLSRLFLYYI